MAVDRICPGNILEHLQLWLVLGGIRRVMEVPCFAASVLWLGRNDGILKVGSDVATLHSKK